MEANASGKPKAFTYVALPSDSWALPSENTSNLEIGDATGHLRLMRLLSGDEEDAVRFELQTFAIRYTNSSPRPQDPQFSVDGPSYEAVSYCWLDDRRMTRIWHEDEALTVSQTVYDMLLHLRSRDVSRWLWIDAICINQADLSERAYQVSAMRVIYNCAIRTLIWLGLPTSDTEPVLRTVERLTKARKAIGLSPDDFTLRTLVVSERNRRLKEMRVKCGLPRTVDKDDNIRDLVDLARSPYFERVWIVQEVTVAREAIVIQGHSNIGWDEFSEALLLTAQLEMNTNPADFIDRRIQDVQLLSTLREIFQNDQVVQLRKLLNICWKKKATDPRDKVYALAGISDCYAAASQPSMFSYHSSVADAYRTWTIHIMEVEDSLEVLSAANKYPMQEPLTTLSWVPDWSSPGSGMSRYPAVSPAEHLQATSRSKLKLGELDFDEHFAKLGLKGMILDEVVATGKLVDHALKGRRVPLLPGSRSVLGFYAWCSLWQSWEATAKLHSRPQYEATGESTMDAFWQTISYAAYGYNAEDIKRGQADFSAWYDYFRRPYLLIDWLRLDLVPPLKLLGLSLTLLYHALFMSSKLKNAKVGSSSFNGHLTGNAGWRRMIRTEKGLIGLASHKVDIGDAIGLFQGGRIPLVLRRSQNDDWRLVGDTYVHGVMQGECWDFAKCQTFWIS